MGHDDGSDMPRIHVLEWTVDEVADYIDSLGLRQYHETFLGMYLSLIGNLEGLIFETRECGTWGCPSASQSRGAEGYGDQQCWTSNHHIEKCVPS